MPKPWAASSLERKLYELIYIRVSLINQCRYCLQHHLASSKRVGLTSDDWAALKQGDYTRFAEKEQAALSYMPEKAYAPDPQQRRRCRLPYLKKHFSDAEIVDLHVLVGLANLTNRLTDPLGLDVEFPDEKI